MSRILFYIIGLVCLNITSVAAQFNDTIDYYLGANLAGNVNKTTVSANYLFNNNVKFSIRKDKLALNTSNTWVYGENAGKLVNNDFLSSTDFNIYHKKEARFNYWGLINYTSSYSLQLQHQFQAGAGLAYQLVKKEPVMLRLSNGLLYERSLITLNDSAAQLYSTIRNSLRVQFRLKIKKFLSFESAAFWQPSLTYSDDYIINMNVAVNLKLLKWLSFTSKINYMQVSRTKRENLLFTYGVVIEQYF